MIDCGVFFMVFNVILLLFVNHSKDFFVIYRLPDDWYYPWNHGRTYDLSLDFFNNYIYIYIYFNVAQMRIHRVHIRHNLIQATLCHVYTYHNGYTIHVLLYFLYIYTYIYTHIHIYRHSHVSIYTFTHIYVFKPEVFFLANANTVHIARMQKYSSYLAWCYTYIFRTCDLYILCKISKWPFPRL